MAEARIELVERLFDAFRRRDGDALLLLLDPHVEYFAPDTARLVGRTEPYVGFAGVQEYLRDISRSWREMRVLSLQLEPVEKGVVALGRIVTHDLGGAVVDAPAAWLFEIADGKITRVTLFRDQAQARQAAGLE